MFFLRVQEVKEYLDAEHLTAYPTSDLRTPLSVEMRTLKSEADSASAGQWRSRNEVGSVDSSDTYISCKSQPFYSQGDLTAADDLHDTVFEPSTVRPGSGAGNTVAGNGVNDSNLYVNPLECPNNDKGGNSGSACGKGGLARSLGTSPMDECKEFGSRTEASGSRGSLNETVKQRKTRFSQVSFNYHPIKTVQMYKQYNANSTYPTFINSTKFNDIRKISVKTLVMSNI